MRTLTIILLLLILIIGTIAIIIVKLYYRNKEGNNNENKELEEFIKQNNIEKSADKRKRPANRRIRTTPQNPRNQPNQRNQRFSEAQIYANTINDNNSPNHDLFDDYYKEPIHKKEKVLANGIAEKSLRTPQKQRVKVKERTAPNTNRPPIRNIKQKDGITKFQEPLKPQHTTTINSPKQKISKPQAFQEPLKPEHTATINSAKQKDTELKPLQVPMTKKQKEFIKKDTKQKLVVEDPKENVKVVKSIKPDTSKSEKIEETEKTTEEKTEKPKEETKVETQKTETQKTTEEKTEKPKEETKVETEKTENKTTEKPKEEIKIETEKTETQKTIKEKTENQETVQKPSEPVILNKKPEQKVSETIYSEDENRYHDDLQIILNKNKEKSQEEYDYVENDEIGESESKSGDIFKGAINTIKNIRNATKNEEKENINQYDESEYGNNYSDSANFNNETFDENEYIGDTITITPIHEEEKLQEPNDLTYNQPNENVDEIYKEINNESYNKTIDKELDESYKDVNDDTYKDNANTYTEEDYKQTEKEMEEEKLREENTKKLLKLKERKIKENKTDAKIEKTNKNETTKENIKSEKETRNTGVLRKTAPMERHEVPQEEGQERLIVHKHRDNVEEIYIDGTLYELTVGKSVIYEFNDETYSSTILKIKPGHIGVKYRSKKIWIKTSAVKKVFK